MDARRGVMDSDRQMIHFLQKYGVKWQVGYGEVVAVALGCGYEMRFD